MDSAGQNLGSCLAGLTQLQSLMSWSWGYSRPKAWLGLEHLFQDGSLTSPARAGAWQETIHCHTDLSMASQWKPHFYDLTSNHTHPFCNSPLFAELLPYFVWEETRQKHDSRRWGLLEAVLENHRHVWENACLCKKMTNTNTFLAEILRKSNCVQLSNLSCIWPRNTCGRSDWTPLSFQLAAHPREKRTASFTKHWKVETCREGEQQECYSSLSLQLPATYITTCLKSATRMKGCS